MENFVFDNELVNELHQFFFKKDKALGYSFKEYFDDYRSNYEKEYDSLEIGEAYEATIPQFLEILHIMDICVDCDIELDYYEYPVKIEKIKPLRPYPFSSYEKKFKELCEQLSFLSYEEIKPLYDEVMSFYLQCQTFTYKSSGHIKYLYQEECGILSFIMKLIDFYMTKQYQKEQSYKEFRKYTRSGHLEEDRTDYEEFCEDQTVFSEEFDDEQEQIEQRNLEKIEQGKKIDDQKRKSKKSRKEEHLDFGEKKYEKGLSKHPSRPQKKKSLNSLSFDL